MKSKLLLLFIATFYFFSCNNSQREANEYAEDKTISDTAVNEQSNLQEPISPSFPTSDYFEVIEITKSQFSENSKYEMELEILNKSDFNFTNFSLSATIAFKMQNEDITCERSAQFNEIIPKTIKNWRPRTKQKFRFTIDPHGQLGCLKINYERTPESIDLTLEPFIKAVSVDKEVEGPFIVYDLLTEWKEKQTKMGLR